MIDIATVEKYDRINELTMLLNYYRDQYYNYAKSEISDYEYDNLYDELKKLEDETGYRLANSPTQSVGYIVKSELIKVKHNHPMLSLDKTKDINDVVKFLGGHKAVVMAKMDGLTCSLRYVKGKLFSAETRGDGFTGEDVLHNIEVIKNVPKTISIKDRDVIIDGEVVCTYRNFNSVNSSLSEDMQYKHIRNYASGSIRLLDSSVSEKRLLDFIAWDVIEGCDTNSFMEKWKFAIHEGFRFAPIVDVSIPTAEILQTAINTIQSMAKKWDYPIDGCVIGFDDIAYGYSLGQTAHHFKNKLAFKFYDETYPSKLKYIDWTIGKTGTLTPTAVFNPVNIDGTTVERASLHNISIIKTLGLRNHCSVYIKKCNQIIPQVDSCDLDGDSDIEIPKICPICGGRTEIKRENDSEVLVCTNDNCDGKKLAKFINFVGRKATNIVGLSEATLADFIAHGYIHKFKDIYHLDRFADEIVAKEGFGKKSVSKLLEAIEKSRKIKLENYITAIGITNIGIANAKIISNKFNGDYIEFEKALNNNFDFTSLDGFGDTMNDAIYCWRKSDTLCDGLAEEFEFIKEEKSTDNSLKDLRFCITGSFSESRDIIKEKLEARGAIFVSSVSKKLDVLFVGENAGSKLTKANELGIKVADEKELYEKYLTN